MPRRASSSPHPLWWLVALAILVVAVIGGAFLFKGADDPYRTVPALEVDSYLENANSLRGNVYKFTGTIRNSLAWSAEGRMFSVTVDTKDAEAARDVLPVVVPSAFNAINIQKGQKFQIQVEVGARGILTAKDLQKT